MTTTPSHKPNWSIALGIPFLIYLLCLLIPLSSVFTANRHILSNAILGDLLITAPLIYFLAIRKTGIAKLSVLRVFAAGILFAGFILRGHSEPVLQLIRTWISPLIELLVVFIICRKFYAACKNAKAGEHHDFLLHCRRVIYEIVANEKAAAILSSEIAVFYYAFSVRKRRPADYLTRFSSYKENGLPAILIAILFIFLIEAIGMHFLLSLWNKIAAWIITGLSLYTCMQLFAHIRAIKARPIILNPHFFEIHNGLAGDSLIELDNINKIELSSKTPGNRSSIKISLLKGLEPHNVVVYLKKPVTVTKAFGIKKQTDTVLFFVDKPKEFMNLIHEYMANGQNSD